MHRIVLPTLPYLPHRSYPFPSHATASQYLISYLVQDDIRSKTAIDRDVGRTVAQPIDTVSGGRGCGRGRGRGRRRGRGRGIVACQRT